MIFSTGISMTLGNHLYDAHVRSLRVSLSMLPGVNSAVAVLPSTASFSASPGDDAAIELSAGDTTENVMTGTIRSIERRITSIVVTISDGSSDLHSYRPATTFEGRSTGKIIQALAGDANVSTGRLEADVDLAAYVAEQGRTAGEHAAHLARLSGCLAFVNSDNELCVVKVGDQADVALRYGRDIFQYRVKTRKQGGAALVAIGNGPAGSATGPDALRHTVSSLPSEAPSPGLSARWQPYAILRTPSAASGASEALNAEAARKLATAEAQCIVSPQLRLGSLLEIAEAPDGLGQGPWVVTGVCHEMSANGHGRTHLRGESAGGGGGWDLGAILGSLF